MLNCREFLSRVTDFSCGDLAVPQMRETKCHLARCASCASYWTSYRATVALARRAYGESDQAPTPEDLVSEILAAARTAPRSFLSPGAVELPRRELGFRKGFLVRDPDGHVLEFVEKRR